jgi:hypothetical protein
MTRTNARVGLLVVGMMLLGSLAWAAAPAGRYTVNEQAATVLDNKTGLTWQRAVPSTSYTWANAQAYCQGLNLGGFSSGWRLPTKLELETLVDVRVAPPGPAIDTTAFPATPAEAFWTSSPRAGSTDAWFVFFFDGYTFFDGMDNSLSVRCVR